MFLKHFNFSAKCHNWERWNGWTSQINQKTPWKVLQLGNNTIKVIYFFLYRTFQNCWVINYHSLLLIIFLSKQQRSFGDLLVFGFWSFLIFHGRKITFLKHHTKKRKEKTKQTVFSMWKLLQCNSTTGNACLKYRPTAHGTC